MEISPNNLAVLIKYIDNEYINSFKSGEIHFTQLKYFRDKEISDGNKTIGDKNEGHVIKRYSSDQVKKLTINFNDENKNALKNHDFSENLGNNRFGHALEFNTTSKDTDSWGISCFTILKFFDSDVFSIQRRTLYSRMENTFYNIYRFTLRKKFINKLYHDVGGKNRSPIILLPPLLKKIKRFQRGSSLPVFYNPVTYYSDYDQSNVDLKSDWDSQVMQAAFTKDNHYKNQKEFRVISFCDVNKIGNNINIGNLEDCIIDCKEIKPKFSFELHVGLNDMYDNRYSPFFKTRFILQLKK